MEEKEYEVVIPEMHYNTVRVKAKSPEEAFYKVYEEGDYNDDMNLEFSHQISPMDETWSVNNEKGFEILAVNKYNHQKVLKKGEKK